MSDLNNQELDEIAASTAATRSSRQSKWDIMFQYLREYTEMHGNALVPNRYEPFPPLGAWVSTQRRHYKTYMEDLQKASGTTLMKNSSTPLSEERIQQLESIGFVWSTTDPRHVRCASHYFQQSAISGHKRFFIFSHTFPILYYRYPGKIVTMSSVYTGKRMETVLYLWDTRKTHN